MLSAGASHSTAVTSPVVWSVTVYGATPPVAFMPPWQPAQLNAEGLSPVGAKICAPQLDEPVVQAVSVAPACRDGSNTQYSGRPMTTTTSSSTP